MSVTQQTCSAKKYSFVEAIFFALARIRLESMRLIFPWNPGRTPLGDDNGVPWDTQAYQPKPTNQPPSLDSFLSLSLFLFPLSLSLPFPSFPSSFSLFLSLSTHYGPFLIVSCASPPLLDTSRFTYLLHPFPPHSPQRTPEKFHRIQYPPDILHNSWKLSRRLFGYTTLYLANLSIFLFSSSRFYPFHLLGTLLLFFRTAHDLPIFAISPDGKRRISCQRGVYICTFHPLKSQFLDSYMYGDKISSECGIHKCQLLFITLFYYIYYISVIMIKIPLIIQQSQFEKIV